MPASPAQKEMECRYAGTVSTIRRFPGEADTARGTATITTTVHRRTGGKRGSLREMATNERSEQGCSQCKADERLQPHQGRIVQRYGYSPVTGKTGVRLSVRPPCHSSSMDRAPVFGTGRWGFESLLWHGRDAGSNPVVPQGGKQQHGVRGVGKRVARTQEGDTCCAI